MISRRDLPQLNEKLLSQKEAYLLSIYDYCISSIKPIQSDRLPFDDARYLERYVKIVNDTYKPLIVDSEFNLIDGHHRYDIMRRMEFFEVTRVYRSALLILKL